ncbi:MAG: hypothetical protein ACRESL_10535, partial [Pseudomonas sp.]
MTHPTEAFRTTYRASIHPCYNPWLHAGFVFGYGLHCVSLFWSTTQQIQPLEWLTIPLTLIFFNLCIYLVHRHLGHHKHSFARLFYARHTGDHHSFFTPAHMTYDSPRDWRVILFPAWLILAHSLVITLPAWWLLTENGIHDRQEADRPLRYRLLTVGAALNWALCGFDYLPTPLTNRLVNSEQEDPTKKTLWLNVWSSFDFVPPGPVRPALLE